MREGREFQPKGAIHTFFKINQKCVVWVNGRSALWGWDRGLLGNEITGTDWSQILQGLTNPAKELVVSFAGQGKPTD